VNLPKALVFAFFLMSCGSWCIAQEPSRGPDGGTTTHVSGVELLSIPGKPFSAHTSTDWTRTLADGSTVVKHLDATLARDGRGRIYRERRTFVPGGSNEKARLNEVHLYDPISRSQALCAARTFQCVITDYAPVTTYEPRQAGTTHDGSRTLTREALGSDTIEGIYVVGTRETTTINPGVMGNDRPIVSVREFWYSDELQTNLLVTRIDPVEGTQVIRLSGIQVGEPDPHLFALPIGYSARDERSATLRRHN
jgi:hypothetical protein